MAPPLTDSRRTLLQKRRDALEKAVQTGALRISMDGKSVEHFTRDQLRRELAQIDAELNPRPPVRRYRLIASKGL